MPPLTARFQSVLEDWFSQTCTEDSWLDILARQELWPGRLPEESRKRWKLAKHIWNRCMMCICVEIVFLLSPITVYQTWHADLIRPSEAVGGFFFYGTLLVEFHSLLYRRESFQRMVAALETMRALGRQHRDHPKEVLDAGRRLARIASYYYMTTTPSVVFIFSLAIPAYCLKNREFPLRFWLPYDHKISPNFELTIIKLMIPTLYGIYMDIVLTALLLSALAQTVGQLKLLNHNIVNVVSGTKATGGAMSPEVKGRPYVDLPEAAPEWKVSLGNPGLQHNSATLKGTAAMGDRGGSVSVPTSVAVRRRQEAEQRLKQCAIHHQAIASLVAEIPPSFGPSLLVHLGSAVVPVVIAIILVLCAEEINEKVYMFVFLASAATAQQGLICFLAEKVAHESSLTRDAVFGCDWLDQSESFKRSMRVIMSRSNQPLVVRLLGVRWCLETFLGVLKLTYSYYMSISATLKTKPEDQM